MIKEFQPVTLPTLEFQPAKLLQENAGVQTWAGHDLSSGRPVVVKHAPAGSPGSGAAGLLREEARILSELKSPLFAELLALESTGDGVFLIVSQLAGRTLEDRLTEGPLSLAETLQVGRGLLEAIGLLHSKGIIHCDLKPAHVLLDGDRLGLCDFGLSRRLPGSSSDPVTWGTTPAYASPETLGLLRREVTEACDLYAAGAILSECLSGQALWNADTALSDRLKPPPLAFSPAVPLQLKAILERLLQPDPETRYATCGAALHDWIRLLHGDGSSFAVGATDRRRSLVAPNLVGREYDLAALLHHLQSDVRQPLRLSAPSGRGKSRLLDAFAQAAASQVQDVLWGRCRTNGAAAFPVWTALALDVFHVIEKYHPDWQRFAERLGIKGTILAKAFPVLRPLEAGGLEVEPPLEAVCDALVSFLEVIDLRLLLIFDDLQWADPFTLRFLEYQLPPKVTVVGAYREEEVSAEHSLRSLAGPELTLSPLGPEAGTELLLAMAGPLPAHAISTLIDRGCGEPFLLQSLLLGAEEMGILAGGPEGWSWKEGLVQAGLRGGVVLAERLALLDTPDLTLLRVGALLGRRFSIAEAAAIAGADAHPAKAIIRRAVERHLLWSSEDEAIFTHDKIRESVSAGLSQSERQGLHRRAAELLESYAPADPARLAHHWSEAGEKDFAFPYALQAGDIMSELLDYPSAASYYRLARDNWREHFPAQIKVRTLRRLAESYEMQMLYHLAIPNYHEALDEVTDVHERVQLLSKLCVAYSRIARVDATLPLVEEGFRLLGRPIPRGNAPRAFQTVRSLLGVYRTLSRGLAKPPGDPGPVFRAQTRFFLAMIESAALSLDKALLLWALATQCEALAQHEAHAEGAISWANAGVVSSMMGSPRVSIALFEQARKAAQGVPLYVGQVTAQSAFVAIQAGRIRDAVDSFEKAIVIAKAQGDYPSVDIAESFCALLRHALGQFDESEQLCGSILTREHNEETNYYAALLILARCGRADAWESVMIKGRSEGFSASRLEYLCEQALGLLWLRRDQPLKALPFLERATRLVVGELFFWGAGSAAWLATTWRLVAERLPAEGQALRVKFLKEASQAATRSLKDTRPWAITQPQAYREAALAAAHAGRWRKARALFEQAFQLSESLEMAFESTWTLYERGRFAAGCGWSDWLDDRAEGLARVRRLGGWIPGVDLTPVTPERHLAKLDRFDRVLRAGRRLVSLSEDGDVVSQLLEEAQSLLRCERVGFALASEALPDGWSQTLHERCLTQGQAVTEAEVEDPSRSMLLSDARSTLMAPLYQQGEVYGVVAAWQRTLGGFFGEEEMRLGDYLTTLAGAGLENARILAEKETTLQALGVSEQRFRGFFHHAGVGTALLDHDGLVLEENPFLGQLLNRQTVGARFQELCHSEDRVPFRRSLEELRAGSKARSDTELRVHRQGGEVVWAQCCVTALPVSDGGAGRYLLTLADTTYRRIAEMLTFLENERRGLSAEVHDGIAQNLSLLHMLLSSSKGGQDAGLQEARELSESSGTRLLASKENAR